MASIQFLGATGTVTGSKYLIEACGKRLLIDAGLFQGKKELRLLNRKPPPIDPSSIDVILLTHAHIDHLGYLPVLVREGFSGPVYATAATVDLAGLLLPDSGRLQEEEAATANKLGYSKHSPALPLYTEADARRALDPMRSLTYGDPHQLLPGLTVTLRSAGHILGSATIQLDIDEAGKTPERILFSGDLGRYDAPVVPDPQPVTRATTLLIESTYGDRTHGPESAKDALARAICDGAARHGVVLIPSFAVGRTQELLYYLRELEDEQRVPVLDVYVDSPMAIDATPIYAKHREDHDAKMHALLRRGIQPFCTRRTHFTRSVAESKRINAVRKGIIISASGMCTGGRILHHLALRLPERHNTVLFVGYQAEGTRGRQIQDGASEIKMHGQLVPVRATIETVHGFSAHADANEIMRWLDGFTSAPKNVFCVHGEDKALTALQARIAARGNGWKAIVPSYLDKVQLG